MKEESRPILVDHFVNCNLTKSMAVHKFLIGTKSGK